MRYFLYTFVLFFVVSVSAEAQIFKKIKEKVTESAEESASKRIEKKAEEQVEKGLDEIFEDNEKSRRNNANAPENPYEAQAVRSSTSNKKPPATYAFDYILKVEMHIDGEMDMGMDYLLSSAGNYYAMEMNEGVQMLMVTDIEKKAMFQFMEMGATKMLMVQDLDFTEEEQENLEDLQIKKIPNKTIMGFNCEGVEMINSEMRSKIYFTKDAPVNFTFFNDPEQSKNFAIPKEIEDLMNENVLMLEMQMEDLNEGYQVLWKAKTLDKQNKKVNTSGYQRM